MRRSGVIPDHVRLRALSFYSGTLVALAPLHFIIAAPRKRPANLVTTQNPTMLLKNLDLHYILPCRFIHRRFVLFDSNTF